mgnify:CR=1 FL=1
MAKRGGTTPPVCHVNVWAGSVVDTCSPKVKWLISVMPNSRLVEMVFDSNFRH